MFFSLKEQTHRAVLFNDSAFIGSIILDNFKKYIFVATRANEIYCLTSKGELVWTAKLEGENNAGVLFNDYGDVIAINSDGDTKVLSRHNGKVIDSYQLPVFHNSVPVCRKHKLYGATLGREIYCFDYRSKKMNWLIETNGRMYSKPTLHRDYLLVGDNNGYVHILDKKTGEKLYQLLVSERVTNPIKISKESIFVSTFANELYSFENFLDETKQVENEMKHPTINHDSNNQT